MNKENNCTCVVCQVEQSLLDSLSTQTARTHFQALARNYPILSHFDSPADVIAQLHEHEDVEIVNHIAWNAILHALVGSIADGVAEETGQQLLLLAYAPAIHKVYREVCQKFPGLCHDDVAQQAALCFLETARSPEIQSLNGHLPAALARRFRQSLFRWAIGELRQSRPLQEIPPDIPELQASNFEEGVVLEHFLSKAQRLGVLSASECELVRKFHCEGFQPEELRQGASGPTAIALYRRIQRAVHRLRRIGVPSSHNANKTQCSHQINPTEPKNIFRNAVEFSGEMCTRKNEKGFSPELPNVVTQLEPDIMHSSA
ncbi:MAG TPA: hypothetical protein VNX88_16705 [Terriglobales bacterium]|jgi:hypothetical protein|nr:hypothetical protein [Terriglobales bacterium]